MLVEGNPEGVSYEKNGDTFNATDRLANRIEFQSPRHGEWRRRTTNISSRHPPEELGLRGVG
jgi:hypothetical protein